MSNDRISADEFTRMAAHSLLGNGRVVVVGISTLELQLEIDRQSLQLPLTSYYEVYLSDPESLPQLMEAVAEAALDRPPDRSITDPRLILSRILPVLKPAALASEAWDQGRPMIHYRVLADELAIIYAIDEGDRLAYVNPNHLQVWGISPEQLHRRALANLRQRTDHPRISGTGRRSLLIWASGDGFDASRILLTDLLQSFGQRLNGQLVIGVPTRDLLLAFGDSDRELFDRLSGEISTDATTSRFALTDQLFTLREGQLDVYQQE